MLAYLFLKCDLVFIINSTIIMQRQKYYNEDNLLAVQVYNFVDSSFVLPMVETLECD